MPSTVRRHVVVLLAGLLLTGAAVGCGSGASTGTNDSNAGDPTAGGPTTATGTVTVLAAASLKDAFTEIASAFRADNPGADVQLAFGASSALAQQISEGAPAEVFASADEANMAKVVDAGLIAGEPSSFATNSLAIIVEPGNPEDIATIGDLARPGLVVVAAAPEVPIGRYSAQVTDKAGVVVKPSSFEPDVKAIVTKVTSGEADAGIVYATDVTAAGPAAAGVAIPPELNVVATYPIAVTTETGDPSAATAWVAFVLGPRGQAILATFGFGPA